MIIGNNTLLGTVAPFNYTATKKLRGTTQEAVLSANQKIVAVHIGWGPGNGSALGTVKACLYDQGNVASNKPMIAGSEVTIPFDASTLGASNRWISVTGLNIDVSAHAGKTLCPGLAPPGAGANSGFSVLLGTVTGAVRENSSTNSTSNTDPFIVANNSANQAWSLYFETADITPSVSVTSINGGSPISAGKTAIPSVSTGFTGLPTTITTNASGVTCSNISGTVNAPEFDISDRVDGGLYPKAGTVVEFTFNYSGIEIASRSEEVTAKDNETIVSISSPLFAAKTIANQILLQTGRTVATGDEFYHTTYSDLVITPDTDWTVTDAGSFDLWLYVSSGADAGKMYQYTVTIAEGGGIQPVTTQSATYKLQARRI